MLILQVCKLEGKTYRSNVYLKFRFGLAGQPHTVARSLLAPSARKSDVSLNR